MNARRILVSCLLLPVFSGVTPIARSASGEAFPVTIEVDAGTGRGDLHPIWRFFGADEPNYAYMKDGRKLLANLGKLGTPAGVLPHPQPAHHRRRHARPQVGQHERLHRGRPGASRSTTGRSSTASSTPTWSAGSSPTCRSASCPRRSRPSRSRTSTSGARACPTTTSTPAGPIRRRTTASGPSWSTSGSSTASRSTDAPRSSAGTGRSGTSRTSATGKARPRSSTSCTTTPSTPCAAPCPRPGSAGRTPPGRDDPFLRDFLEHCLRGTNHATGGKGTPLDFIAFHAKGAAEVRGRPRADGHRQPAPGHRRGDGDHRVLPGAEGEADRHRRVRPRRLRRLPGPAARLPQRHDVLQLHRRQLRPQARPGGEARRQPRGGADLGVRVRGPAVLRRLPRARHQRRRPAGAERLPHVRPDGRPPAGRARAPATSASRRS